MTLAGFPEGFAVFLPAGFVQQRRVVGLGWVAEAEVAGERPVFGGAEGFFNGAGVEDGDPADADVFGAGREPERVDRGDGGILQHFGHGLAAKAVARCGIAASEDGEVNRGLAQASQFQGFIAGAGGVGVILRGGGIGGGEIGDDLGAQGRGFDL